MYRPSIILSEEQKEEEGGGGGGGGGGGKSDEKKDQEPRKVFAKCSVNSKASGSCLLEFGNTKVLTVLHGPRAKQFGRVEYSDQGELKCLVKFAPFSKSNNNNNNNNNKSKSNNNNNSKKLIRSSEEELSISEALTRSLTKNIQLWRFPKSVIDITVLVLDDDGGVLSACVLSSSMALIDSGLDLYDTVTASSIAIMKAPSPKNHQLSFIVDPNAEQEAKADAIMNIAYLPCLKQFSEFSVKGQMSIEDIGKCTSLGIEACSKLHSSLRVQIVESIKQKLL